MALYFYYVNFGVSLLLALVYGFIFHKRFDVLVSKHVYKEKMSFQEANRIILAGMGSQFDPALIPITKPCGKSSKPIMRTRLNLFGIASCLFLRKSAFAFLVSILQLPKSTDYQ